MEAISYIKEKFNEKEIPQTWDRHPNSVMAVTNYDSIEVVTVQNLVADWRRLQTAQIVVEERTAKQMS